jgi:hypothetical protein
MPIEGKYLVMPLSAAVYYQLMGVLHDPESGKRFETIQWIVGGYVQEETPALGFWIAIDAVLDQRRQAVEGFDKQAWRLVRWEWVPIGSVIYATKPASLGFDPHRGLTSRS